MKRLLIGVMVFGFVGSLAVMAGCSKAKVPQAKEEPALEKGGAIPKEKDITAEPIKKEASGKEEVIDLGNGVKLEMILIPAGKFKMGSPLSEDGRNNVFERQHEVTLTKSFYIGKYEVTQEQGVAVMGGNPSLKTKGAKLPVTDVSWNACQDFIKKLNPKTNGGFRLPTEAEWEYACRAGTTTAYSFGDRITPKDANYKLSPIVPVGSYKPNEFGLYDMHGNVSEWCQDLIEDYPVRPVTDPKGPARREGGLGGYRIFRGGHFQSSPDSVRSSERRDWVPNDRLNYIGFRLAKTP